MNQPTPQPLLRGRSWFDEMAWEKAKVALLESAETEPLEPEDLDRLAIAAFMSGDSGTSVEAWAQAHRIALDEADPELAVRFAFWICFVLGNQGDAARAGGWLARANKLTHELDAESVAAGFVLLPEAVQWLHSGRFEEAAGRFAEAAVVGHRTRDPDLHTLAALGRGQALVGLGRPDEGMVLLDEAMVAVTGREVSPLIAGLVYCAVIGTCYEMFDVERAQEWTEALVEWCDAQPGIVPFRGQCLVHRSELLQLHGAWPAALEEVERALTRLLEPPGQYGAGDAFYQLGELHRLAGRVHEAEDAYRRASEWGKSPHPGLALLRLAQGRYDIALTSIRRVLEEDSGSLTRFTQLAAQAEIALEVGDVALARTAADQLSAASVGIDKPFVRGLDRHVEGSVLLREGRVSEACTALREAASTWRALGIPHEAARVRVLLGLACRELGDGEGAELEFEAARATFESLRATPDLERLDRLTGTPTAYPDGLTAREVQVLRLVAAGSTNREIADELVISEKTVARHLSNIFVKVSVPSRAAATAYAYRQGLVLPG